MQPLFFTCDDDVSTNFVGVVTVPWAHRHIRDDSSHKCTFLHVHLQLTLRWWWFVGAAKIEPHAELQGYYRALIDVRFTSPPPPGIQATTPHIYLKYVYCRPYQGLCPDACQFYTSLNPCHSRTHSMELGIFSTPKMNVQGFISKHAPLSSSCFKFSSNCNITFSLHNQIPFTLCANFIWMSHLPLPQGYASTCVVHSNK